MWRARIGAMGLGLSLAGVLGVTSAHAACTKDVDCEGELICEAGECVQPAAAPEPAPIATPAAAPLPAPMPPSAAELPPIRDDVEAPEPAPPVYKRRSRGMMVTGIVLTSLGTLALAIAIVEGDRSRCDNYSSSLSSCTTRPNYEAWGATAALLGVGIPLLVIGGQKVRDQPTARATLAPWLSPHSAGLGLRLAL